MYVLILEKRISAKIEDRGKSPPDWYVLLAVALPFEPSVGFEIQLKGKRTTKLTRVVYNPDDMTFWAKVPSVHHPRPDAQSVAQNLVDVAGWDIAVDATALEDAMKVLHKKAMAKLQQALIQAQLKMMPAFTQLRQPPGSKRRH